MVRGVGRLFFRGDLPQAAELHGQVVSGGVVAHPYATIFYSSTLYRAISPRSFSGKTCLWRWADGAVRPSHPLIKKVALR